MYLPILKAILEIPNTTINSDLQKFTITSIGIALSVIIQRVLNILQYLLLLWRWWEYISCILERTIKKCGKKMWLFCSRYYLGVRNNVKQNGKSNEGNKGTRSKSSGDKDRVGEVDLVSLCFVGQYYCSVLVYLLEALSTLHYWLGRWMSLSFLFPLSSVFAFICSYFIFFFFSLCW